MYYEGIDINEGSDPTKSNKSKECMIWHYCFFNHEFKRQDSVRNDLTMLCLNISDITIITAKNVNYPCIIHKMVDIMDIYKSLNISFGTVTKY